MSGRKSEVLATLAAVIPRSQAQLESELVYALKVGFWVALLAPVAIVPAYYLALALLH